jgi:hypothetical protein
MSIMPLIGRIIVTSSMAIGAVFPECYASAVSSRSASPPTGRPGVYRSSIDDLDNLVSGLDYTPTKTTTTSPKGHDFSSCAFLVGYMDSLEIFFSSKVFDVLSIETFDNNISIHKLDEFMEAEMTALAKVMMDVLVLPLLNEESVKAATNGEKSPIGSPTFNGLKNKEHDDVLVELKDQLSVHTARLFVSMYRYGIFESC